MANIRNVLRYRYMNDKKPYKVKTKERHKRVLANMVDNGGNMRKAIAKENYSKAVQDTPSKITETRSFKELMAEQGLTNEYLNECLKNDIDSKSQRFQELQLAYRLSGALTETKAATQTNVLILTTESAKRYQQDG